MAEVNWTAEAERWLAEIHQYIAQDNPAAARRLCDGIISKAQILSQFPEIGYRHDPDDPREVRILLYGHYRIAYLIRADRSIDVLGVFHAALDIERFLH